MPTVFLDSALFSRHASVVKRLLQTMLVLGAMIGLFGQGLALAYAPQSARVAGKMVMADDCMPGMKAAGPAKQNTPCKGLTLACIAAMGCTIPLVVPDDQIFLTPTTQSAQVHGHRTARRLAGRDLAPEPDPPSLS